MRSVSWLLLLVAGCAPKLDDRSYLIQEPRLLDVIAEPAEARPGELVELTPVFAGPPDASVAFRFCSSQGELSDPRPVPASCLDEPGTLLERVGSRARGFVPTDACARFGPDPVSGELRPTDADGTGGFYLPVVVEAFGEQSTWRLRVRCSLPDAPAELARELEQSYVLNLNPPSATLEGSVDGSDFSSDFRARSGSAIELRASWPAHAREAYVWLPPDGHALAERHESLRVSWFTSSGALASSATGRDEDDETLLTSNDFSGEPGAISVRFWAVLQDSRGGSSVVTLEVPAGP